MTTSRTPRFVTNIQYADGSKTILSDDKPVVVHVDMNNWNTVRGGWYSRPAGAYEVHVHMDSMTSIQVAVHKHDLPTRAPEYFHTLGEALVRAEELVTEYQAKGQTVSHSGKRTEIATRLVLAKHLLENDWLAYGNPHMNQRVVEVTNTRDGQVKVYADFGNGGEPATLFFDKNEVLTIVNEPVLVR